ncbi:HAD-like domain-containing protein, partial [Lobosporangium transversale]
FIGTLPPLGPLPHGFISTMPDRTESTPAITLVLDIDETLVHCATRPLESPDIIFPVEYNNETWEVYGRIRPGMHEFLEKTSAKFEVITFTASQECYAEALLKIIDPEKKYIKHRYYRDSCIPVFGNYIKDLRILNRDLSKVVIIDNSPQAFGYQISNGVPIDSWYDDKSDRELSKVMSFLETLEGVEDVRPRIDEQYRLQERLSKALAQLASHQQISSMNGLGALGTTLDASFVASTPSLAAPVASTSTTVDVVEDLSALQEIVPDHANVNDTSMMIYEIEFEKPPSPSDEDENECDEKSTSRMRRGGPEVTNAGSSGIKGGSQGMTMTTRSSLDATRHLVSL